MLVARYDDFGWGARFDPETGELGPERALGSGELPQGHYGTLSGHRTVLYRAADVLWLRMGALRVELDGSTKIEHRVVATTCLLTISHGLKLHYPAPQEWDDLGNDLTPFAEAEDFDFGLFIANIAQDPVRAARIYH